MSKHTPGPWRWTAPGDLRNEDDIEVGDCLDRLDVNHQDLRCEADAYLIAAAPDLLAACEQVLKDLGDRLTGKTVLMLREAVAKAKGQP